MTSEDSIKKDVKRLERRLYTGFTLIGKYALDLQDKMSRELVIKASKDARDRLDKMAELRKSGGTEDQIERLEHELERCLMSVDSLVQEITPINVTEGLCIPSIMQRVVEIDNKKEKIADLKRQLESIKKRSASSESQEEGNVSGVSEDGEWFDSQPHNDFS